MTVLIATIATAGPLLMLLTGYLIALDGAGSGIETEADRDARLAERDYLAPARQDLTEPVDAPWPWRLAPEPGLSTRYRLYEQLGVNHVRPVADILRDIDNAAKFRLIVESHEWKCLSCLVGLDGEYPHQSCQGCPCHCGDSQGAQIIHIGRRVAA